MGTNYYLHKKPPCECCGREFESLHVGKSSGGWCFSLHVIPENGINTLEDWKKLWSAPGAYILDEYGKRVSIEDLEAEITERNGGNMFEWWDDPQWWLGIGERSFSFSYRSEADFHERNYSERGPNGLLRHRIGDRCIAHGEGTWDCLVGEFS
jgi:hypothetical protein